MKMKLLLSAASAVCLVWPAAGLVQAADRGPDSSAPGQTGHQGQRGPKTTAGSPAGQAPTLTHTAPSGLGHAAPGVTPHTPVPVAPNVTTRRTTTHQGPTGGAQPLSPVGPTVHTPGPVTPRGPTVHTPGPVTPRGPTVHTPGPGTFGGPQRGPTTGPSGTFTRPPASVLSTLRRNEQAQRRFHANPYRPPHGYAPRRWSYGQHLPRVYFERSYWITDFLMYSLFGPPPGYVWVRVGDDALLVDEYTGEIIRVEYGVFY